MSNEPTTAKVEELAQEAASFPPGDSTPPTDDMTAIVARIVKENDALKEEMKAMKSRVTETVRMGRDELKAEIAHHPMQSVATAFALGFIASLVVRR